MTIQIFIAFILIIRFNPIRHHTFNKSDSDIIFASALFLLLNASLTKDMITYLKTWIGISGISSQDSLVNKNQVDGPLSIGLSTRHISPGH
jgi:hypothetical protein